MTEIYIYRNEKKLKYEMLHEIGLRLRDAALKETGYKYASISHTDRFVCVAVSDGFVGVDIELSGRSVNGAVMNRALSLAEKTPENMTGEGFLRMWTLKEAYGKSLGAGLMYDYSGTDFFITPEKVNDFSFVSQKDDNRFCYTAVLGELTISLSSQKEGEICVHMGEDVSKLLHMS